MATKQKQKAKPAGADAEEYRRFLETAKLVGAADDPAAFDRAFEEVAGSRERPKGGSRRK